MLQEHLGLSGVIYTRRELGILLDPMARQFSTLSPSIKDVEALLPWNVPKESLTL